MVVIDSLIQQKGRVEYITKEVRPIYLTLPSMYSEYASPEFLTDSGKLVEFFEHIYFYWNREIDSFLDFDGTFNNFRDDQLDALAPFFGFTTAFQNSKWSKNPVPEILSDFYNTEWSRETKIKLFKGVFNPPFIWRFRGSEKVFNYVADSLGLKVRISRPNAFIAGISKAGDVCGYAPGSTINILYPEEYYEQSNEYSLVLWLQRNFVPLHIRSNLIALEDFI